MAVTFSGGWSRLKGLFARGGVSNPDEGEQHSGPLSRSNDAQVTYTDDRALQVSAVWSCVRLITETVGSLPVGVYQRDGDTRTSVDDHYLSRLFREAPNADMTPQEFREAMTSQLAFYGNGYSKIDWSGKPFESEVIALNPLRADCMTPVRSASGVTYHYLTDKGTHVFAKENILHIKGWGFDGLVGLSPLQYGAQSLGITLSADKYASSAFGRNGRPVGVLTTDRILTADQRKDLKSIYDNVNADDSTGTWVLEAGLKYQQITMTPDTMQMLQTRSFQLGDIARFYRVPSFMINDSEKSTTWGTGIEQQNLGFLAYTIRPYLTRWESAVSGALLNRTDRRKYFIEHNVEGLLRADSAARSTFYSQMAQNGLMTRNEIRKKENLPAKEGGDDLTVQVNLTPVGDLPKATSNGNQEQPVRSV
jgi:HK97 family phage portal protein